MFTCPCGLTIDARGVRGHERGHVHKERMAARGGLAPLKLQSTGNAQGLQIFVTPTQTAQPVGPITGQASWPCADGVLVAIEGQTHLWHISAEDAGAALVKRLSNAAS